MISFNFTEEGSRMIQLTENELSILREALEQYTNEGIELDEIIVAATKSLKDKLDKPADL